MLLALCLLISCGREPYPIADGTIVSVTPVTISNRDCTSSIIYNPEEPYNTICLNYETTFTEEYDLTVEGFHYMTGEKVTLVVRTTTEAQIGDNWSCAQRCPK